MKKKAFTLIELVVSIAIISLIMSIVIIRFDLVKKVKEKNEVSTILADMNYCKEKARVTGINYAFSIDGRKSYSIIMDYNMDSDGSINKVNKSVDLDIVDLVWAETNKDNIIFLPRGSVINPQSIRIEGLDSTYILSVGVAGGSIQIEKK